MRRTWTMSGGASGSSSKNMEVIVSLKIYGGHISHVFSARHRNLPVRRELTPLAFPGRRNVWPGIGAAAEAEDARETTVGLSQ